MQLHPTAATFSPLSWSGRWSRAPWVANPTELIHRRLLAHFDHLQTPGHDSIAAMIKKRAETSFLEFFQELEDVDSEDDDEGDSEDDDSEVSDGNDLEEAPAEDVTEI